MFLYQDSASMKTKAEIVKNRSGDVYCRNIWLMVGTNSTWLFNKIGLLCRKWTVDDSIKIIVPQKYRVAVPNHAHHPKLEGHPGARRMFDSERRLYYWPH